jgi:hypothetical protein
MRCAAIRLILVLSVTGCGSVSPQQFFSGSATLNWDPVTKDTRGNTLENLAGYKIHYGASVDAMDTVEMPTDPSQTTYTVNNLSPGTWYFAVSAYTTDGAEGALSDVASKTIPQPP